MPTRLPRKPPTVRQGVRLYILLAAFYWHGYRRRAAGRRMIRIGIERGYSRWERAARRWLACSAEIAALLGDPEPPEVHELRETLGDPPPSRSDA